MWNIFRPFFFCDRKCMDLCCIDPHSDDAQPHLIILSELNRFLCLPLVPWLVGKNAPHYHAIVNWELCAWDIVAGDVKHRLSVSFWSSFRQDTERLLFLISSACNGSDSWWVCVCAVTTALFPIDTVPAVLWTLPSTDCHLGCCNGGNTVLSVFHTTLWKSASTWVSWQLMQGKRQPAWGSHLSC